MGAGPAQRQGSPCPSRGSTPILAQPASPLLHGGGSGGFCRLTDGSLTEEQASDAEIPSTRVSEDSGEIHGLFSEHRVFVAALFLYFFSTFASEICRGS